MSDSDPRLPVGFRPAALLLGVALLVAACGDGEKTRRIEQVKEVGGPTSPTMQATSSAERFGGAAHGGMGMPARPRWAYDTPEGWQVLPPAPMRDVGWQAPGGVTCTFTAMQGNGGGLVANVNRWRGQMGLGEVDAAAVDALPNATLLGQPAKRIELDGTYGGMGGQGAVEDARMLGLLAVLPQAAVFLKMTGPAEAVAAQTEAFEALATSIRPAPTSMQGMPPGHGMRPPSADAPSGAARVAWDLPEGWKVTAGRTPFKESSFQPKGEGTEAWISILAGDGGGLEDNINRWRRQMGQPPLGAAEVAALPRLEAMGREGTLVTIEGRYAPGMGGSSDAVADATMLGFALLRGDDSVFVKMVGPADAVMAQKEAFEAFCRSLRNP